MGHEDTKALSNTKPLLLCAFVAQEIITVLKNSNGLI